MKKVINFYKKMPFNIYDNAEVAIKNIKNFNLKETYPFLDETIKNSNKISIFSPKLSVYCNKYQPMVVESKSTDVNISIWIKSNNQLIQENK